MKTAAVVLTTALTRVTAVAAVGLSLISGQVLAQESPWLVRTRAVHINPADKSDAAPGAGIAKDAISVSSETIPELDISYFFTPNIAAELVLTYPQKHTVKLNGAKLGTFKHLPPTLTLQYHFTPSAQISPYVGAGVNYTLISSEKLGGLKLENDSVGLALQVGVDFKIDKNWSVNVDVKKVQLRSDVLAGGTKLTKLKIDPYLIGVGVGYRF